MSQLTVKATQGFEVTITRTSRHVELHASNDSTAAIYVVRTARERVNSIKATFPGLGRVSLRFHPQGKPKRQPPFCKGRAAIKRVGQFRGVIRFEGEQGFTRVAASRAQGFTYRSFREVCENSKDDNGRPTLGYSLTAGARLRGGWIAYSAFRSTEESVIFGDTHHFVSVGERRHGMKIARVAVTPAPAETFAVDLAGLPRFATVSPPPPFSGTASFNSPADAPSEWQGTLAVELPGAGTVPLTGSSFKSELCLNSKRCAGTNRGA